MNEQRGDIRPVPDPTELTSKASAELADTLRREDTSHREFVLERVAGVLRALETRLNGMDTALELLQAQANRVPSETTIAVTNLRELHEAEFRSIATRFVERDNRDDRITTERQKALDAALSAVEKSNAKTEAQFTKQIDDLRTQMGISTKNIEEQLKELKQWRDQAFGAGTGQEKLIGTVFAAIGAVVGLIGIAGAIIALTT